MTIEDAMQGYAPSEESLDGALDDLKGWLKERLTNTQIIASQKTGDDRAGWLEDAYYFRKALTATTDAAELVRQVSNLLTALEYEDMARIAWDESGAGTPEFERWSRATGSRVAHALMLRAIL